LWRRDEEDGQRGIQPPRTLRNTKEDGEKNQNRYRVKQPLEFDKHKLLGEMRKVDKNYQLPRALRSTKERWREKSESLPNHAAPGVRQAQVAGRDEEGGQKLSTTKDTKEHEGGREKKPRLLGVPLWPWWLMNPLTLDGHGHGVTAA
jgi:hypothetical protein